MTARTIQNRTISTALERMLSAGVRHIGQVVLCGDFALTHHADAARTDLQLFNKVEDAREIAKFDDAGNFRPLKSAPNLRRGWRLEVRDLEELQAALDGFYPAMLGIFLAHERKRLMPVNLRETLIRQSGMYAVTKRIANAEADELVGSFCRSDGGCLKTVLWKVEPNSSVTSLPPEKFDPAANQLQPGVPAIPLLCHEACNLLVAAARAKVKGLKDDE